MCVLTALQTKHQAIKEINKIFFKFIGNDKGDKIKRKIMINDCSEDGLKMIDVTSFNKFLKAIWIKKYLDAENCRKWKVFFNLEIVKFGGNTVFQGNLNKKTSIT